MARTNVEEVKEIIDINSSVSTGSILAFIKAANLTVTDKLGDNTDLSDSQKKEIERWLTAHLLASTLERQASSEKAGDASITYQGETGEGLKSTFYGQMCLVLDTTGTLNVLGKRKVSLQAVESFD